MLCRFPNVVKSSLRNRVFPIFLLNTAIVAWTPVANAQAPNGETPGGLISGSVLVEANKQPATQVAVTLKSQTAGIFRSVLTDYAGHFEVSGLPPSTYEIVVEEQGYQSARTTARFDGSSSQLVIYLKSSDSLQAPRNSYTVSMHELKIPYKAHEEYVKGLERLAKNDLTESLRHFAKAAKTFPDYYEAYYHMGLVETKLGHKNEAKQAFQTSIDLSGGRYAWAQFGFGYILFLEGKLTEAETLIRRGLELDANSSEGYVILGMTQLALNHLEDAEKSAREALLRNPGYAKAFLVLADVCSRRHDYRAQLQNLEAYLKLDPAGSTNQRIRQAREMAMQLLAKSGSPN